MAIILAILGVIVAVPVTLIIVGIAVSGPRHRGPVTDHFDGKRFVNPLRIRAKGGLDVFKWMISRRPGHWRPNLSERYGKHPLAHFKDGIRITFVNHSTFLIQVDGVNILTDPIWAMRASPFKWTGPKRTKLPGIRFGDLPRIHVVLLSHNHYDHLDLETMRIIYGAHHPRIIVPLGVRAYLERQYIDGVHELDWWEDTGLPADMKVQAVPAQHFSGRGLLDRDASLWCGYVLRTRSGNIYFAGDTGYNDVTFREIRQRCGSMRVALIPIGAYKPGWFMAPIHVCPDESVRIHQEVEAETSIAMHFGTFPLADDGHDDPLNELREAMGRHEVGADRFLVLNEGGFVVFE